MCTPNENQARIKKELSENHSPDLTDSSKARFPLWRFASIRQCSKARITIKFYRMAHKPKENKKKKREISFPSKTFPRAGSQRAAAECWLPSGSAASPWLKTRDGENAWAAPGCLSRVGSTRVNRAGAL